MATFGFLLLALGIDQGREIFEPGPVLQGHAEVGDCEDCHTAFDGNLAHWLMAAFRHPDPAEDSAKCLTCHKKGPDALRPHNLPVADLEARTKELLRTPQQSRMPVMLTMSEGLFERTEESLGPLACAACHKEHEGESFDPTLVSNQRCQSCHSIKFSSLAEGHPPLDDYPYRRRQRIAFDHHKHFKKNFEQAKTAETPESCGTCHRPDAAGQFMLVESFEKTCTICHRQDIEGESVSGPKGILVLAVPGLDTETLSDRGFAVGHWPETAITDALTPFTELLLARDAQIASDLEVFRELDLQDLSTATDDELATAQRVAWAFKELLLDLTDLGAQVVQQRLESELDRDMNSAALGRVFGQLPLDVVVATVRSWFPGLKREVSKYREEKAASLEWRYPRNAASRQQFRRVRVGLLPGGTSYTEGSARTAKNRPIQLAQAADDLLSGSGELLDKDSLRIEELNELLSEDSAGDNSLFDAPAAAAESSSSEKGQSTTAAGTAPTEPLPEATQNVVTDVDGDQPKPEESVASEKTPPEDSHISADGDVASSDAPRDSPATASQADATPAEAPAIPPVPPEANTPANRVKSLIAESQELLENEAGPEDSSLSSNEQQEPEVAAQEEEDLDPGPDPELWARAGGWFRLEDSLFYRPVEHLDPFMRAWLDIAVAMHGMPAERYGKMILATFKEKDTPGKCTKCHSIDRQENGEMMVNWSPFEPNPDRTDFTTFDHTAHFSLVQEKGCTTCHELNGDAAFAQGYKDHDPVTFTPNFAPLDLDVCASCHVEESAGEDCVMCHRYHIGEFPKTPVRTLIAELELSESGERQQQAESELQIEKTPEAPPTKVAFLDSPAPLLTRGFSRRPISTPADPSSARTELEGRQGDHRKAPTGPDGPQLIGTERGVTIAADHRLERQSSFIALQLASFKSRDTAAQERVRLQRQLAPVLGDKPLFIDRVDQDGRGIFYRVLTEPLPDKQMAENLCRRMKEQEQDCIMVPSE